MSRKRKWPPAIYHHPNGQDRVRICTDGKCRDVWLGPTGSAQAQAAYSRLLAELTVNGGRLPEPSSAPAQVTVAEVAARWLQEEGPRFDPEGGSMVRYERALKVLVRLYGPTPAAEFGVDELEALRLAMATGSWLTEAERQEIEKPQASRGKPPSAATVGWCRNTVNRAVVRVRTVWRWAERKKMVPRGSWDHLRTVRRLGTNDVRVRQTRPRRGCSQENLDIVLAECRPQPRAMLLLQWTTGMRSKEVRLIRPCDLDRTSDVWLYRPRKDKTSYIDDGVERVVPLGPEAQKILKHWLGQCQAPEQHVFRPRGNRVKHDHYSASAYAQLVADACERCGVKIQPYSCRHAAKSRLTRLYGLDVARAVLGQRSLGTANNYDSQVDLASAIATMRVAG